jgi:hypothetical protein
LGTPSNFKVVVLRLKPGTLIASVLRRRIICCLAAHDSMLVSISLSRRNKAFCTALMKSSSREKTVLLLGYRLAKRAMNLGQLE